MSQQFNPQIQALAKQIASPLLPWLLDLFTEFSAAWAPTYDGATPGTTTYASGGQRGTYLRVGPLVVANGYVEWTNATGSGTARISLPFLCRDAAAAQRWPVLLTVSGVTWTGSILQAYVESGDQFLTLAGVSSAAAPTAVTVETAGLIAFTAIYPADEGDTPAAPALTDALSAFWPMNAPGQLTTDLHTNGLTLTDYGTVGSAAGLVYAGAADLNGTTQYLGRNDDPLIRGGNTDWTVGIWVYLTSKTGGSTRTVVAKVSGYEFILDYVVSTDRFRIFVYGAGAATAATVNADTYGSVPTDTWLLLLAGFDADAGEAFISVNGGAEDLQAKSVDPVTSTGDLTIGRRLDATGSGFDWVGRLGPAMFWRRRLTPAERTDLYNSGAGLPYPFS